MGEREKGEKRKEKGKREKGIGEKETENGKGEMVEKMKRKVKK